jgi:hypothetical protein
MKRFDSIIQGVFLIIVCLLAWEIADLKSKMDFAQEEPPK